MNRPEGFTESEWQAALQNGMAIAASIRAALGMISPRQVEALGCHRGANARLVVNHPNDPRAAA